MNSQANYIFSAYSTILKRSNNNLLQVGNLSGDSIPIPSFDEDVLINLCLEAQKIFQTEENTITIDGDTIVVGDIHGSLHDLLRILNYIESDHSKVLFLGDYVDRGFFSLECVTILFSLKVLYPDKFFLLRGNHEFDCMCSQYGFKKEILNYHNPKKLSQNNQVAIKDEAHFSFEEDDSSNEKLCDRYFANHVNINCYKYTKKLYCAFLQAFSYLPICAIVNKTTICIHGGLSPQLRKVSDIAKCIQRPIDDFKDNQLLGDLVWGDPTNDLSQLFNDNPRGFGKLFNGVSLATFLKSNNLKRLIRGHECVNDGCLEMFNEKCITVFSASSYSLDLNNKCGILKIHKKENIIKPIIFDPLPRLKKCDACYYKVQAFNEKEVTKPILTLYNTQISQSSSSLNDENESIDHGNGMNEYSQNTPLDKYQSCPTLPENRGICLKRIGQVIPNYTKGRKDKCSIILKKQLINHTFNTGIMNKISSSNTTFYANSKNHPNLFQPPSRIPAINNFNVQNQPDSSIDNILMKEINDIKEGKYTIDSKCLPSLANC